MPVRFPQLILATGSHAGITAGIHAGYYMIGRDKECQIRPKSRSVSRRHCLLLWKPDDSIPNTLGETASATGLNPTGAGFRVFDLESTTGTQINGVKIPPLTWVELPDDAELRCGKVAFRVSFRSGDDLGVERKASSGNEQEENPSDSVTNTPPESGMAGSPLKTTSSETPRAATGEMSSTGPSLGGALLSGGAWKEADVAGFLAAQDDADREERYETIRSQKTVCSSDSGVIEDVDTDFQSEVADDRANQTSSESRSNSATSAGESPPLASQAVDSPKQAEASSQNKASSSKRVPPSKKTRSKKPARQRRVSFGSAGALSSERLKIILAVLLCVAVLGFGGYRLVKFLSGPPVRVIDGID